jgi:hypothetical protein
LDTLNEIAAALGNYANLSVTLTNQIAGVQGNVTAANAAITTANTAMKGYVDAINSTLTSNAAVQAGAIADTNTAITTANTAMKGYVDSVANLSSYSNANVSAYLPTYSGNISAANVSVSGNLTVNRNATITGNAQIRSLGIGTAASGNIGEIRATNAITAFYSDRRLKTNFVIIENPLDKVDQLTGLMYTQNSLAETFGYNDYSQQVGVFAQDVQQVQPEAVKPAPFDIAADGSSISGEHYLTVQYEKLVPLLIEAIKELRKEINQLKGL